MVDKTTKERLAVIETEIKEIKNDVADIKKALTDHAKWEEEKYSTLKEEFASKWVERLTIAITTGFVLAIIGLVLGKI